MWSKTKQVLESRLAESLKGRISYHYDVYRTNKSKGKPWWGGTEMHVLSILVDGTPWFCSNPMFFCEYPGTSAAEIIRETGLVACEFGRPATEYIHQYLNVLSIEEAIAHENYFIRLLAVLDARLGKRRIKDLVDNIDHEPEWFRKWIMLRAGNDAGPAATRSFNTKGTKKHREHEEKGSDQHKDKFREDGKDPTVIDIGDEDLVEWAKKHNLHNVDEWLEWIRSL